MRENPAAPPWLQPIPTRVHPVLTCLFRYPGGRGAPNRVVFRGEFVGRAARDCGASALDALAEAQDGHQPLIIDLRRVERFDDDGTQALQHYLRRLARNSEQVTLLFAGSLDRYPERWAGVPSYLERWGMKCRDATVDGTHYHEIILGPPGPAPILEQ